jgi:hypothetical protein
MSIPLTSMVANTNSGEYDFIFCGGYCPGFLETGPNTTFPASKNLVVYSQPGSGHAINLSVSSSFHPGCMEYVLMNCDGAVECHGVLRGYWKLLKREQVLDGYWESFVQMFQDVAQEIRPSI